MTLRNFVLALSLVFGLSHAALANSTDDPCAGIRLGFHESIAGQGFLGVLTPKTSANLVRRALERNIELAKPGPQNEIFTSTPVAFDWAAVCKFAKARNLGVLWVGCHADTEEDSGEYYGSLATSKDKVGLIKAECVVSTWNSSKKPSWSKLVDTALFHSGGDQKTIYPRESESDGDRYDQLKKEDVRLELYVQSLNHSVELFNYDQR
ncbi:MAG: hypothetical protein HY074_15550 [Deltaproteobacteria bacterium]|nr:hypothetical protein [Deltaproteobacteria bacterium]